MQAEPPPESLDPKWGEPGRTHDPWALANFKARPTDVLITTAPKAGTTWMQQILHQLRSGGDDSFESIFDVVPWIEYPNPERDWRTRIAAFERLPDPRIFKTHCTRQQTPGADIVRIVLTSRDPRDCCVSMYHHQMNLSDAARATFDLAAPASFDEFFDRWMGFGAWYRNVASWWPHRGDPNVLWLRYEDLVDDLEQGIDRLLPFLGWRLDPAARARVLEYCSFAWMKRHSDRFTTRLPSGELSFKPKSFIRKGAIGDHEGRLSPAQAQQIIERARRELPPDCVSFLGL